jgi:hypothetical protein
MATRRFRLPGTVLRLWTTVTRPWAGSVVPERTSLPLLLLCVAALAALSGESPGWVPPSMLLLPLLVGALVLRPPAYGRLFGAAVLALVYELARLGIDDLRVGNVIVIGVVAAFGLRLSRSRAMVGVQGMRGESMLVDLRDRLLAQGTLPELPKGWGAEAVIRSAGGPMGFSGDFLVAALRPDGAILEMVLVDVSGKGVDAGTRALLLSGALSGLLGALPPEDFLPAANAYLLRQRWGEGFATAVHLVVDLDTGEYLLSSAGHPPAAQFSAGSGKWRLVEVEGTVLGVDPKPGYVAASGILRPGDAVLLYTDGLVEIPGRDLGLGIDKLLGEAERVVTSGFDTTTAVRLIESGTPTNDDRALVMLWRR